METQKTLNSQSNLEKEKWSWKNQATWLQTILQSYSHLNSVVLAEKQKYRSMEEDTKPRNKLTDHWSINYDKRSKNIQWRRYSLFNRWCLENWTATWKRIKLKHSLTPYTKINSKRIKDLQVRLDTIKLLEENIGKTPFEINHRNTVLHPSPRAMEIKTKINKWDLIKVKSFCTAKENINKINR